MSRTITLINNLSSADAACQNAEFSPSDAFLSKAIVKMWNQEFQTPSQPRPTDIYFRHDYGKHKEAYNPATNYYPPQNESDINQSSWQTDSNWKTWAVDSEGLRWDTQGDFKGLDISTWYISVGIQCSDYPAFPDFILQCPDTFEQYLIINLLYLPDSTRNCVYYGCAMNVDGQSHTSQILTQPAFVR